MGCSGPDQRWAMLLEISSSLISFAFLILSSLQMLSKPSSKIFCSVIIVDLHIGLFELRETLSLVNPRPNALPQFKYFSFQFHNNKLYI